MKKFLFAIAAMALLVACNPEKKDDPKNPADEYAGLTEPQSRKVVIEEYTGINCGYCPDGHRIVNEIIATYPDKVFGVNIHTGSYANNTYTTTEGASYASEAKIKGYPAGCVNRHLFSSYTQKGGMAMSRGDFEKAAKEMMAKTSPVNIKATAEINQATRELTVEVKGYYVSDPVDGDGNPLSTNSLYVMLLQDSVMGIQSGASSNPDQVVGGQYRHMHMLRKTIPDTWGDDITPKAGTGFTKKYQYTIPETIGTDKVMAVLKDLKVLVFIAEGHKEIYTACEPKITLK